MTQWTSKLLVLALLALTSCEKSIDPEEAKKNDDGNVGVEFRGYGSAAKVALMAFNTDGSRAISKVKTGVPTEPLGLSLTPGDYVLVAVAHSSASTPSLKSPQQVVYNAKDGRKLTDTYCLAMDVTIGPEPTNSVEMPLRHATAAVRFRLADELPDDVTALRFDYSGCSANVNPSTLQGCTKSNQSELRPVVQPQEYVIYTFPYMAIDGVLKITVCCIDAHGSVVQQATLSNVSVVRGKVTTIDGCLFSDTGTTLGFTVDDWNGEDIHHF